MSTPLEQSEPTTTTAVDPAPRRPRVSPGVGAAAGLLALGIVVFAACAVVWGLLRPTYGGTVTDDGMLAVESGRNVEFTTFITFTVVTGLLGVALAVVAFVAQPRRRSLPMLLWVGVVAAVSAVGFALVGDAVATLVHPVPDHTELAEGQTLQLVPPLAPGIGLVAAPLMATLTYWVSVLMDSGAAED